MCKFYNNNKKGFNQMFIMINQRPSIGEVGERIGTDLEIQFTLDCDSHHTRVTTVFTQHISQIWLKIQVSGHCTVLHAH